MNNIINNTQRAIAYAKKFTKPFYAINTTECDIKLQADYDPEILDRAIMLGFRSDGVHDGYTYLSKANIKIILT